MKKKKRIISILMMMILFWNIGVTAYATESKPPTGSTVENGQLSFRVGYIPSGKNIFTSDITVKMNDIATGREYQFLLKADKAYNASESYSIIANTTYKVTLSYPDSDKFEILNVDGTPVTSYHATQTGLIMTWQIKEIASSGEKGKATNGEESQVLLKGVGMASDMVKAFSEKTQFTANDNNYKSFLGIYAGAAYKELYLKIEGNTEESWNTMTTYEKASYSLLYSSPRQSLMGVNRDIYAKDRNTFIKNLASAKQILNTLPDGDIVYDAIVEAWDWHWQNWDTQRTFINPFGSTTYGSSQKEAANDNELDQDNNAPGADNTQGDLQGEQKQSVFLNGLKKNFVSITILLIVGIFLLVIRKKNRISNYKDSEE